MLALLRLEVRRECCDQLLAMVDCGDRVVRHPGDQGIEPEELASLGAARRRGQPSDRLACGVCERLELRDLTMQALERVGWVEVVEMSVLRYSELGATMHVVAPRLVGAFYTGGPLVVVRVVRIPRRDLGFT